MRCGIQHRWLAWGHRRFVSPVLLGVTLAAVGGGCALAQTGADMEQTAASWARATAERERAILDSEDRIPVSCLVHKVDAKGSVTRRVIDTTQGTVARLLTRDGQSLTTEQNEAERSRLQAILDHPEEFIKHHKEDPAARGYARQLIDLMPTAMLYSYVPGQPQAPGSVARQVVLAFRPNPTFHPPSLAAELLTGMAGRLWIDPESHVVVRAEVHVVKAIDLGWGVLAHLYPGGTVVFDQQPLAANRWIYSHVEVHVRVRELMVHTRPEDTLLDVGPCEVLATPVSFQQAVAELMSLPIALR